MNDDEIPMIAVKDFMHWMRIKNLGGLTEIPKERRASRWKQFSEAVASGRIKPAAIDKRRTERSPDLVPLDVAIAEVEAGDLKVSPEYLKQWRSDGMFGRYESALGDRRSDYMSEHEEMTIERSFWLAVNDLSHGDEFGMFARYKRAALVYAYLRERKLRNNRR
jgi:hypothetical protein